MEPTVIQGGEGAIPEPDWGDVYTDPLDVQEASHEWGLVLRELRGVETLSFANGHMIERLVHFRVQYRRALRHVGENGPVSKPKGRAKAGQWNPYWSVMRQCDEAIRLLEVELGIPPVRRKAATKAPKPKGEKRASDDYLSSAAKRA